MIANDIINTLIPYYWICVQGGVQVLDPNLQPTFKLQHYFHYAYDFLRGPSRIINMPMYMPHKGAMYNPILMNIANNPDGGPSKKKIMSNFAFNDFELL
jgi:hypothetical protein